MSWLENLFGPDLPMSAQIAIFAAIVIAALLILFWLFRKIFGGASARLSKSRQPRLSVTDAAVVDDKRRLVLVRRDNVEHLIMIGGPTDVVIEQSIVKTAPVSVPPAQPYQPAPVASPAPETPAQPTPAPRQVKTEPDSAGMFANPVKSTTAIGGAALAGAGALAMSAKEQTAEAASDVASAASDAVSNVADTAVETAGNATEGVGSLFETAPEPEAAVNTASLEEPKIDTESLGADLDTALNESTSTGEPQIDAAKDSSKTEDEMQRLLKELADGN